MTHLYKAALRWRGGQAEPLLETACGLRKAFTGAKLPVDVTERIGLVTCPECLAKAQSGKKAQ